MSTRGLERRGRELLADYVRRGGGLLIAVGPGVDGEVAAEMLGPGVDHGAAGIGAQGSQRSDAFPGAGRCPASGVSRVWC